MCVCSTICRPSLHSLPHLLNWNNQRWKRCIPRFFSTSKSFWVSAILLHNNLVPRPVLLWPCESAKKSKPCTCLISPCWIPRLRCRNWCGNFEHLPQKTKQACGKVPSAPTQITVLLQGNWEAWHEDVMEGTLQCCFVAFSLTHVGCFQSRSPQLCYLGFR